MERAKILRHRLYDDHVAENYCGTKVPNEEWVCTRPKNHPKGAGEYHEVVYYTQTTGIIIILWSDGGGTT